MNRTPMLNDELVNKALPYAQSLIAEGYRGVFDYRGHRPEVYIAKFRHIRNSNVITLFVYPTCVTLHKNGKLIKTDLS